MVGEGKRLILNRVLCARGHMKPRSQQTRGKGVGPRKKGEDKNREICGAAGG